jgi:hypothetical protein
MPEKQQELPVETPPTVPTETPPPIEPEEKEEKKDE